MIIAQRVSREEMYILFTSGNVFRVSRAEVIAMSGTRTAKISALRSLLASALADQGRIVDFALDILPDGSLSSLAWSRN